MRRACTRRCLHKKVVIQCIACGSNGFTPSSSSVAPPAFVTACANAASISMPGMFCLFMGINFIYKLFEDVIIREFQLDKSNYLKSPY